MADLDERSDRASALERFATTPARNDDAPSSMIVPMTAFQGAVGNRVVGAQELKVRRDEGAVLVKLKALAAAAGNDWFYRWSVAGKDGSKSFVEGPSIKLANDLARLYGNCDVSIDCVDTGNAWLFKARFVDWESGYALERLFQQRKSQRSMKTDADRQLDIAFQIGQSKAERNVIVNALQTFADFALEEAKGAMVDKIGRNLDQYRSRILDALHREGVELKRVERIMGRASADWRVDDVAKILAMMRAVADGMATWDETFPALDQPAPTSVTDITDDGEAETQPQQPQPKSETATTIPSPPSPGGGTAGADRVFPPGSPDPAGDPIPDQPSAADQPQEPIRLSLENKATLQKYSDDLLNGMSARGLQQRSTKFLGDAMPDEGTPMGNAINDLFKLHLGRVNGDSSPAECEQQAKKLIGRL